MTIEQAILAGVWGEPKAAPAPKAAPPSVVLDSPERIEEISNLGVIECADFTQFLKGSLSGPSSWLGGPEFDVERRHEGADWMGREFGKNLALGGVAKLLSSAVKAGRGLLSLGDDFARGVDEAISGDKVLQSAFSSGSRVVDEAAVVGENLAKGAGLGLRAPAGRHSLRSVKQGTVAKDVNTVVEPGVDIAGDVAAINQGLAKRVGSSFEINGRVYGVHDDTLFPIAGAGFHTLNRGGVQGIGSAQ